MAKIISVTATGPGLVNALQLPNATNEWMVYLVNAFGTAMGVILPINADVDDLAEFHVDGEVSIYPDGTNTLDGLASSGGTTVTTAGDWLIRKTTATTWQTVANR